MGEKIGPATEQGEDQILAGEPVRPRSAPQDGTAFERLTRRDVPSRFDDCGKARVTMKDIARELGLSLVTVSRAIRNQPDVSQNTRRLVVERAEILNFRPNQAARALATGRTRLVGLVVPDLLHTFFAEIAKSISSSLGKEDYCLTISTTDEDPDLERDVIDRPPSRLAA